ncbi:hypothetical protein, partial [Segatella salivae]|uniref:hypothetical protein n=1 Tax=Segatella salivae TaxID=228604 RepID=UPI00248EEE0E
CADGTAMQCGRVGSRLLFTKHFEDSFLQSAFFVYIPCGPSANRFLKDLVLAGLPQIIPQRVCYFRAWRKSLPEWFGVSAHGESHFPNGLMFPRMAKVTSRMV